jgi:hypothetical protein
MAKAKEPKKPKAPKKGKGDAPAPSPDQMSVAAHPRAAYAVARAKGIGGLVGLVLVGLLSWQAGAPLIDVGLRALAGGIVGYLAFWALAVQAWRHLVIAEARAAGREAEERATAARAAADREPGAA